MNQQGYQQWLSVRWLALDTDVIVKQRRNQGSVVRFRVVGLEVLSICCLSPDNPTLDGYIPDLSLLNLGDKIRIVELAATVCVLRKSVKHGYQHDRYDYPEDYIFRHIIHSKTPSADPVSRKNTLKLSVPSIRVVNPA